MDTSTDGVTLHNGFVKDLLDAIGSGPYTRAALQLVEHVDLETPNQFVPIAAYNDLCEWIVREIGPATLRDAGRFVGRRAFEAMESFGSVSRADGPIEVLRALKVAADTMISDPKGRGWTILEEEPRRAVLRRTQTFHPVLQEGLLPEIVNLSDQVTLAQVRYLRSVAEGAEYDDYEVWWR